MTYLGLVSPGVWRRERQRWIDAAPPGPGDGPGPEPVPGKRTRLIIAHDQRALGEDGQVRGSEVRAMVWQGLMALTGECDESRAWRSLLPGWQPRQTSAWAWRLDHRVTGITCALKNFYGAVPLWDAFRPTHADRLHANHGNPQIAELYASPAIRGKVRLHVCDALEAICDGGPWGEPQMQPRSLLFTTDPVAMDAYVLALIDGARRAHGLASVAGRARYIESAARLGLGTNDPASIEITSANGGSATWPA